MFNWKENLSTDEWDDMIARFGGHPLQSTIWGEARKANDNIQYHRWVAFTNNNPIFLARFEIRTFLKWFKIAWLPRGPIILDASLRSTVYEAFFNRLKQKGFIFCITNPWKKLTEATNKKNTFLTIWLDLTIGKEALWNNLQKQFRYGVRRAIKLGVKIERSQSTDDIVAFNQLCASISIKKDFQMRTSSALMSALTNGNSKSIEAHLFTAKFEDKLCGGAFIIRCGDSIHYMWGGIDRAYSHLCVGEAIQWAAVEWAVDQSCKLYDLEGITANQNSGVDIFKKKLGGEVVINPGINIHALYWPHNLLAKCSSLIVEVVPHLKKYKKLFMFR